jgi:BolA protein
MNSVAATITQLLETALAPMILEVVDDSAKHAGHAGARPGGQTHFSVTIVSDQFAGKPRVARHRMVYDALNPLFGEGLHALAITAKTPAEIA